MLVACVPVPTQPIERVVAPPVNLVLNQTSAAAPSLVQSELPTRTVKQVSASGETDFGLTEDNRIIWIKHGDVMWDFYYENGKLAHLTGPKAVTFVYNGSKLAEIRSADANVRFVYDGRGRLQEVVGGKENLHFDYDDIDFMRGVSRGVAGKTSIDYDKLGKIKYLTRGQVTTNVYYDDKGRVRNFDADDIKFILGYWRDDKIISLTGKSFGHGLSVSYGPNYPPRETDIIHDTDTSKFTAAYEGTLYAVVDQYVYCKYVRRLPDILFEGVSYAFYVNYFKGDIASYFVSQFACAPYES